MNITFFIGNGFDLQNNLKTSFTHFFKYIISNNLLSKENMLVKEYRNDIDKEEWSDFEYKLGQLTYKLNNDEKEIERFMDDLDEFRDEFIKYLNKEQEKFKLGEKSQDTIVHETILNFANNLRYEEEKYIKGLNYNNANICSFLNFNYTNTLSKIVGCSSTPKFLNQRKYYLSHLIHVHRTLNDGTFLGVNDESQLNKDIFSDDELDSLIKPRNNQSEMNEDYEKIIPIIEDTDIIYIFGMSIGETDRFWWNLIADWLKKDKRRRLIINEHVEEDERLLAQLHTNKKRRIIRKVKEKFLTHLEKTEEKEQIKDQIYISIGSTKILNYKNK